MTDRSPREAVKCKHWRVQHHRWESGEWQEFAVSTCACGDEPLRFSSEAAQVCTSCGHWLPLGHSDESDPRVAVEIRAAEMIQDIERTGWTVLSRNGEEGRGWDCAESNMADHSDAWHAGYLARVMVES